MESLRKNKEFYESLKTNNYKVGDIAFWYGGEIVIVLRVENLRRYNYTKTYRVLCNNKQVDLFSSALKPL
ncbi:hypothetical protein CL614_05665 [archaeon]|nr:hypothetical protein [archaeon]|tara:strand:- start:2862 stop:3071 length:210 start_codon:yes stop_codon:yes gene_type:complete